MDGLFLKGNAEAPTIVFNPQDETFEISGKSVIENAEAHFRPAINWLKTYATSPLSRIRVNFNLEYFNISTSKLVLEMLHTLDRMVKAGWDVCVRWYSQPEDDDMYEVGVDLAELVRVPFEFRQARLQPVTPLRSPQGLMFSA